MLRHETFTIPYYLWGALLLCPILSRAESYTLLYSLNRPTQGILKGSRAPKRPLVVDLEGHTLTLPRQVIGYTLTLENEKGEVCTYNLIDTTLQFPQDLSGEYEITIFYGNCKYQGIVEFY